MSTLHSIGKKFFFGVKPHGKWLVVKSQNPLNVKFPDHMIFCRRRLLCINKESHQRMGFYNHMQCFGDATIFCLFTYGCFNPMSFVKTRIFQSEYHCC